LGGPRDELTHHEELTMEKERENAKEGEGCEGFVSNIDGEVGTEVNLERLTQLEKGGQYITGYEGKKKRSKGSEKVQGFG